jgi:hypothetical protein
MDIQMLPTVGGSMPLSIYVKEAASEENVAWELMG